MTRRLSNGSASRRPSASGSRRNCGPLSWPWEGRLTPSPIGKVLSIFRKQRVRALLMGGQACVLYGAAEFSRDVDVAVLASATNLKRLRSALGALRAEAVFVPPLNA